MLHKNSAYVVHFFSVTIYSRGPKFLQVIYESFDCDLTHGFFIHDFKKCPFYGDKKVIVTKIYVIIKKIFIEIMY